KHCCNNFFHVFFVPFRMFASALFMLCENENAVKKKLYVNPKIGHLRGVFFFLFYDVPLQQVRVVHQVLIHRLGTNPSLPGAKV
ncbi:MAG: hypothetical protein ACI4LN_05545, partial [Anaerovoracaceae bacterium]